MHIYKRKLITGPKSANNMHLTQHTLSSAESHGKLPTVTNLGYEWIRNSMASVCWKKGKQRMRQWPRHKDTTCKTFINLPLLLFQNSWAALCGKLWSFLLCSKDGQLLRHCIICEDRKLHFKMVWQHTVKAGLNSVCVWTCRYTRSITWHIHHGELWLVSWQWFLHLHP